MLSDIVQVSIQGINQPFKVSLKVVFLSQKDPVMGRHSLVDTICIFPHYWHQSLVVLDRMLDLQGADFRGHRIRADDKQESVGRSDAAINPS